jgi:ribosome-binding factor A
MKTHRLARVASVIREVAANTILFELRDPRVKNVTVTRAEVAADLQHAKVYVSVMGTDAEQRAALKGLQNAAGFIQSKLADRLLTRFLPLLTFVADDGPKKSIEVARILAEEKKRDEEKKRQDRVAAGVVDETDDLDDEDGDEDAEVDDTEDEADEDDDADETDKADGATAPDTTQQRP